MAAPGEPRRHLLLRPHNPNAEGIPITRRLRGIARGHCPWRCGLTSRLRHLRSQESSGMIVSMVSDERRRFLSGLGAYLGVLHAPGG